MFGKNEKINVEIKRNGFIHYFYKIVSYLNEIHFLKEEEKEKDHLFIEKVIDYLLKNSGVTVQNNEIVEYEKGHQVSLKGSEKVFSFFQFDELRKKLLKEKDYGLWIFDNKIYFDKSIHIDNYVQAVKIAQENNQKAIYAWDVKESIFIR
jgi:hypothetical protein